MSITPLSTLTSYCSATDFLDRYDWRPIAQLMNDAISVAVTAANLADTGTDEGRRLNKILLDCSGEIEASALIGGRYRPEDLQALTGASAAYLKRIVADLAIGRCYERRPQQNPWAQATATARQLLNAIASGESIFGTEQAASASLLEITADTVPAVESRNGVVQELTGYFGSRTYRHGRSPG